MILEITPQVTPQVTPQATAENETNRISLLLEYCIEPRSRVEIQEFMGLKDREYFRLKTLNPLIKKGKLLLTVPENPTSPSQKYYSKPKDPNYV